MNFLLVQRFIYAFLKEIKFPIADAIFRHTGENLSQCSNTLRYVSLFTNTD